MSCRHAAEVYFVSVVSIQKRLKGVVFMDSKTGANILSTRKEKDMLLDVLLCAGYHHLDLGRLELLNAVRTTYLLDSSATPWDLEKDSGAGWVHDFKRHPE